MSADLSLQENSTARPKGITFFAVVWAFWAVAFLLMPFLLIPEMAMVFLFHLRKISNRLVTSSLLLLERECLGKEPSSRSYYCRCSMAFHPLGSGVQDFMGSFFMSLFGTFNVYWLNRCEVREFNTPSKSPTNFRNNFLRLYVTI